MSAGKSQIFIEYTLQCEEDFRLFGVSLGSLPYCLFAAVKIGIKVVGDPGCVYLKFVEKPSNVIISDLILVYLVLLLTPPPQDMDTTNTEDAAEVTNEQSAFDMWLTSWAESPMNSGSSAMIETAAMRHIKGGLHFSLFASLLFFLILSLLHFVGGKVWGMTPDHQESQCLQLFGSTSWVSHHCIHHLRLHHDHHDRLPCPSSLVSFPRRTTRSRPDGCALQDNSQQ